MNVSGCNLFATAAADNNYICGFAEILENVFRVPMRLFVFDKSTKFKQTLLL